MFIILINGSTLDVIFMDNSMEEDVYGLNNVPLMFKRPRAMLL